VQRRYERDVAARHQIEAAAEAGIVDLAAQPLAAPDPLLQRGEIEAGAETRSVAEDDGHTGLEVCPNGRLGQLLADGIIERVALLGPIEPDDGEVAILFVRDKFIRHEADPY